MNEFTPRQERLYRYITERPHFPMTLTEVARALGRSPGHAFGRDMAACRHRAAREGMQITNCAWNTRMRAFAFVFLPVADERELSVRPLTTQSKQFRTRGRNVAEQARYVATNAERAEDRAYGRMTVQLGVMLETFAQMVEEVETVLARERG